MRTATPGRIEVAFSEKRTHFPLNTQFSIPAKGVAGIFGAPGCGKTTVARCIAGLERLSTGFCAIDGEVWQDETTFRAPHLRPIGYVLKEPVPLSAFVDQAQLALRRAQTQSEADCA